MNLLRFEQQMRLARSARVQQRAVLEAPSASSAKAGGA
jgi:hypothetical protein